MSLFDSLLNKAAKGLSDAANQAARKAASGVVNTVSDTVNKTVSEAMREKKSFSFDSLPQDPDELKARPEAAMKDPFAVAALTVAALCRYPEDREACYAMLNVLKGPTPLSPRDRDFIRDRFMDGKNYLPFSYFSGATPQNNYSPALPYTVTVCESAHSRDQEKEGYLTLYLPSGGADSPRQIVLRCKPSTGEWFLWSFEGLLGSIRVPVSDNPWA